MILTTTETISGRNLATLGLVQGSTIQSRNMFSDIGQSFQSMQAKKTRADAKQGKTKSARSKPSKKGGFFAGLKADAPQTVQQSIPYREMYRDGICRLTDTLYTKTVQFFDINYQLAQADDKAQIFEGYCDFLNYFDASIHVQLTFINQRANMQDFTRSIDIPPRGDEYDGIRREYGDMLKNQLQKGNNGLTKRK